MMATTAPGGYAVAIYLEEPTVYDDPQTRDQVKLAQALEAMRPHLEAAAQYLTEMWSRVLEWANAFGERVVQAMDAWYEQYRKHCRRLQKRTTQKHLRVHWRRRFNFGGFWRGIWSSMARLQ